MNRAIQGGPAPFTASALDPSVDPALARVVSDLQIHLHTNLWAVYHIGSGARDERTCLSDNDLIVIVRQKNGKVISSLKGIFAASPLLACSAHVFAPLVWGPDDLAALPRHYFYYGAKLLVGEDVLHLPNEHGLRVACLEILYNLKNTLTHYQVLEHDPVHVTRRIYPKLKQLYFVLAALHRLQVGRFPRNRIELLEFLDSRRECQSAAWMRLLDRWHEGQDLARISVSPSPTLFHLMKHAESLLPLFADSGLVTVPRQPLLIADESIESRVAFICPLFLDSEVLLIGGPIGAGKSTFAVEVQKVLTRDYGMPTIVLKLDRYFKIVHERHSVGGHILYDHVESLHLNWLEEDLRQLFQAEPVDLPVFFSNLMNPHGVSRRRSGTVVTWSRGTRLVVESLFALDPAITRLFNGRRISKLFLNADEHIRFARLLCREVPRHEATVAEILEKWSLTRTRDEENICATASNADMIVVNNAVARQFDQASSLIQAALPSLNEDLRCAANRFLAAFGEGS